MQHGSMCRVVWLCLPCLVLALVLSASARDGRDFAGTYRIGNVSEDGNVVHVMLTLKIFNYSDEDVRNGAVGLFDNQPQPALLGSFAPIKAFRLHQEVTLHQQFDVPKTEYARWMSGRQPNFRFLSDDHGNARMRNIELRNDVVPSRSAEQ